MSKLKILIIEDNEDDVELCKRSLEKSLGKSTVVLDFKTGDKSIELIEGHNPDCVLLDYSLPGRNGLEVLKRIRVQYEFLPVIILTGQGNEEIAVQAMKQGAQDYILKSNISEKNIGYIVKSAIERCGLKEKIESQQQALSLFTQALAHDLKEPLRTIHSFLDLIKVESLTKDQLFFTDRIKNATNSMIKLVKTVQAYTEVANVHEVAKVNCDVNKIINTAINNLNYRFDSQKVKVKFDNLPTVLANESHLVQVFQNLISNAIQNFNKEELLKIEIKCDEGENEYTFSVKDNGPGIKRENLKSIFYPFKRFSNNNSNGASSGLGLAICKKIIDGHGGKIWCNSSLSMGSEFCFTLLKGTEKKEDLVTEETPQNIGFAQSPTDEHLANVLLVDDSIDYVTLFKFLILKNEKLKFNLFTAGNGKEAIDFLDKKDNPQIDLILLDISMPVMDGFDFLTFRKEHPNIAKIPVIMCSTSDYSKDMQQAGALGANDYLVKPLSKNLLLRSISNINGVRAISEGEETKLLQHVYVS